MSSSSRRRRWALLAVLLVAVAAVLLLLRRPEADTADQDAPGPPEASRSPASARGSGAVVGPSTPEPAPAAERLPALGPFTGRIVSSEDGRPVVGAEVTFLAPEGAISVRSGPDGRFRLVPSRPGAHQLAAVLAEGFVAFGPAWGQSPIRVVAPAPAGTPELVVPLDPEIRLTGRVEAADGGVPIAGATVSLRPPPGTQPGLLASARSWVTDVQGAFSGTAPADSLLVAQAPGFAPATEPIRGSGKTRTVTLRLGAPPDDAAQEKGLSGRVVEASGVPVPDAVVSVAVSRRRGRQGALPPTPVTTDAQGRFRFESVPAESLLAQAVAGDLLSDRVAVEPGATDVELTVHPGGVLAGRVLHADGTPATAFALELERPRRFGPSRTLSIIDPDGRYEVRGLSAGAWELQAVAADSGPSDRVRVDLPASPGARVERDLRLRAGRLLQGVVKDANSQQPVGGARVAMESSPGEDSVLVRTGTFTGPDGRFSLEGLPETPVSVAVEADGYNRRIVTLPRGKTEVAVLLRPVGTDQSPATDLVGIGAVVNRNEDGLVLGNLVASGGAAAAGLHPGDVVLRVDGQTVAELGFVDAISRLRGEEGTVVRLEVRRADGTTTTVDVVRRPISF